MESQSPKGWQVGRSALECQKYMFEHQISCDVTFVFSKNGDSGQSPGGTTNSHNLRAHRYILVSRSPVFEAMMAGDFTESVQNSVDIVDMEPVVFKEVLRYMYCDEVELTGSTVLHVLFAAKKYLLEGLVDLCKEFLDNLMFENNVCSILTHALVYQETDMAVKCREYIATEGSKVFDSPDFMNLTCDALYEILSREDRMGFPDEEDVYRACVRWANCRLKQEDLSEKKLNWVLSQPVDELEISRRKELLSDSEFEPEPLLAYFPQTDDDMESTPARLNWVLPKTDDESEEKTEKGGKNQDENAKKVKFQQASKIVDREKNKQDVKNPVNEIVKVIGELDLNGDGFTPNKQTGGEKKPNEDETQGSKENKPRHELTYNGTPDYYKNKKKQSKHKKHRKNTFGKKVNGDGSAKDKTGNDVTQNLTFKDLKPDETSIENTETKKLHPASKNAGFLQIDRRSESLDDHLIPERDVPTETKPKEIDNDRDIDETFPETPLVDRKSQNEAVVLRETPQKDTKPSEQSKMETQKDTSIDLGQMVTQKDSTIHQKKMESQKGTPIVQNQKQRLKDTPIDQNKIKTQKDTPIVQNWKETDEDTPSSDPHQDKPQLAENLNLHEFRVDSEDESSGEFGTPAASFSSDPDSDVNKLKLVLGKCLYKIQFLSMSAKSLMNLMVDVAPVLNEKEQLLFVRWLSCGRDSDLGAIKSLGYSTKIALKRSITFASKNRFSIVTTDDILWDGSHEAPDGISFSVNRALSFMGVSVFGGYNQGDLHSVKVTLLKDTTVMVTFHRDIVSDGTSKPVRVLSDEPLPLEPYTMYTVQVGREGPLTYYGYNGKTTVMAKDVRINFRTYKGENNCTDLDHGQIPQILFIM